MEIRSSYEIEDFVETHLYCLGLGISKGVMLWTRLVILRLRGVGTAALCVYIADEISYIYEIEAFIQAYIFAGRCSGYFDGVCRGVRMPR